MYPSVKVSILFVIYTLASVSCTNDKLVLTNSSVPESMLQFAFTSKLIYRLRPQIEALNVHDKQVSVSCQHSLRGLFDKPGAHKWSMMMLDANAPIPSSLMSDMLTSVGGYDQCLSIRHHLLPEPIVGQYCLLQLRLTGKIEDQWLHPTNNELIHWIQALKTLNRRFPLTMGLCIPSSCTQMELNSLVYRYLQENSLSQLLSSKVEHCQTSSNVDWSLQSLFEMAYQKNLVISLFILTVAVILALLGTIHDISTSPAHNMQASLSRILLCFSLIRNSTILMGTKDKLKDSISKQKGETERQFGFVHGVRCFLILWVIVAHTCALMPASVIMPVSLIARHPHDIEATYTQNHLLANFFNNGTLAVEAFFLISGLLLTTLVIAKQLHKRITFSQFVFLRWIRFAVPLVGIIAIKKSIRLLGNGPFFADSILETTILKSCDDQEWWKSLLFIQNWFNLSDTCVPISWFVAVDLQIHLVAFGLVLLIRVHQNRLIVFFCMSMISISVLVPLTLLLFGVPTFSNMEIFAMLDTYSVSSYILLYSGSHMHFAAYFFGALLGFLIAERRKIIANKKIQKLVWWCVLITTVTVPFLGSPNAQIGHVYKGITIGALHGIWIIALGLLFYQLSSPVQDSHGKSLRSFLSASCFQPLSRLSFSMYLCHMTLIWFNAFNTKVPIEINTINVTLFCFGIFGETLVLAYLLFVLFECPLVNLLKLFIDIPKEKQANDDILMSKSLVQVLSVEESNSNVTVADYLSKWMTNGLSQKQCSPLGNNNSINVTEPNSNT